MLLACVTAGCANKPNLNPTAEFAPIQPIPKAEEVRVTGAIFDNGMGLLGSKRTYRVGDLKVGDLITVLLLNASLKSLDTRCPKTGCSILGKNNPPATANIDFFINSLRFI